jgi:hypothetical protein
MAVEHSNDVIYWAVHAVMMQALRIHQTDELVDVGFKPGEVAQALAIPGIHIPEHVQECFAEQRLAPA